MRIKMPVEQFEAIKAKLPSNLARRYQAAVHANSHLDGGHYVFESNGRLRAAHAPLCPRFAEEAMDAAGVTVESARRDLEDGGCSCWPPTQSRA